jgi:hypothetical protein
MFRYLTVSIVLFTFISSNIFCQSPGYNVPSRKVKEEKNQEILIPKFEFLFSFSNHTSSAFFDKDKSLITELKDWTTFPGVQRKYTFNLKRYSFDLDFKYFATDKLTLQAKVPFTIYNLDETFKEHYERDKLDSTKLIKYIKELRGEFSHSRIDFIALAADYALSNDAFINKYFLEVRIPTGTTNGVINDPQEFWSDGAFEIIPGFLVGTSTDKFTIEAGAKYNYCAEDMTDRVIGNLNFALHTVPGTRFYGFLEGAYNVSGGDNQLEFDIRKMPWQDEYLDIGFGFKFVIEQSYIADFSYRIRLDGQNAWNRAAYYITFGYRF